MASGNPFAADDGDLLKKLLYLIGGAVLLLAIALATRYLVFKAQMTVVESAVQNVQVTAQRSIDQIQRNAVASQQAAAAHAEAEKQAKAQAERDRLAQQQAAIDLANQRVAAKEEAWKRFYKPSRTCANPDNSSLMECANGHARAKTEFEAKWAAGHL